MTRCAAHWMVSRRYCSTSASFVSDISLPAEPTSHPTDRTVSIGGFRAIRRDDGGVGRAGVARPVCHNPLPGAWRGPGRRSAGTRSCARSAAGPWGSCTKRATRPSTGPSPSRSSSRPRKGRRRGSSRSASWPRPASRRHCSTRASWWSTTWAATRPPARSSSPSSCCGGRPSPTWPPPAPSTGAPRCTSSPRWRALCTTPTRQGVVHRDVKPANVLVLPSGEAKVMDFGIARLESARQRLTTTGEFIGTPLYTAPEQAKTEDVDGRADVFSLAPWPTRCSRGTPPSWPPASPGSSTGSSTRSPTRRRVSSRGFPPTSSGSLARALAKDPESRYPTAEAFAEDAEDILAGQRPRHAAADDLVVVRSRLAARRPSRGCRVGRGPLDPVAGSTGGGGASPPVLRPRRPGETPGSSAAVAFLGLLALAPLDLRGGPRPRRPDLPRRDAWPRPPPGRAEGRRPRRLAAALSPRSGRHRPADCGSTSTTRSAAAPCAFSWTTSRPSRSR